MVKKNPRPSISVAGIAGAQRLTTSIDENKWQTSRSSELDYYHLLNRIIFRIQSIISSDSKNETVLKNIFNKVIFHIVFNVFVNLFLSI